MKSEYPRTRPATVHREQGTNHSPFFCLLRAAFLFSIAYEIMKSHKNFVSKKIFLFAETGIGAEIGTENGIKQRAAAKQIGSVQSI